MRIANHHEWMAPHNVYQVSGDDRWVSIAVATDEEFSALTKVINIPELARDVRFKNIDSRKDNEDALDETISNAVRNLDQIELEQALQAAGVMGCRVSKPYLLTEDEDLQHIGFFQELTREVIGTRPYKTFPFRFSTFDLKHLLPPPLLGEHNHEVLSGLLGLDAEAIATLEAQAEIGNEPLGFNA